VYGRPALAVPVTQVQARVSITANPRSKPGTVRIQSPNIGLEAMLDELSEQHPIRVAIIGVMNALEIDHIPACTLRLTSTIPVASGLGSGAACAVAITRGMATFLGHPLPDEKVNALAFEVEKIHHGIPSGIDNTVITYAKPVYYIKGQPIETLRVAMPFSLVIGDTRVSSPTSIAVGDVNKSWKADKPFYESAFDAMGEIAKQARLAIEGGKPRDLGPLMNENQEWLQRINVSSPELEALITAARQAGALGAKLSGGGRGGNMIALVTPDTASRVISALKTAGAIHILLTEVF